MGNRLYVARKHQIEYADVEAFNYNYFEFYKLLGACNVQYTGEFCNYSFEVTNKDWKKMIAMINSLDSMKNKKRKATISKCLSELECSPNDVVMLLKEFLSNSDPDNDLMFLCFFSWAVDFKQILDEHTNII